MPISTFHLAVITAGLSLAVLGLVRQWRIFRERPLLLAGTLVMIAGAVPMALYMILVGVDETVIPLGYLLLGGMIVGPALMLLSFVLRPKDLRK